MLRNANLTAVFHNRNFSLWVAGSSLSLTGFWAQRVAVAWLAWEMTGSSLFVALVAAADLLPAVIASPYAGMIGDRFDRFKVIWWTQFVSTLASILLYLSFLAGALTQELLVAIVALNGTAMGLKQPARMAMLRNLVSLPHLPTAIAVGSIIFNLARFIGPAIAGVFLRLDNLGGVFIIAIAMSASLLLALRAMRLPQAVKASAAKAEGMWESLAAGLRFAWTREGVRAILMLQFAAAITLRGYLEIMPGFSDRMLGAGADGLAILTAGFGAGAVVSGMWLAVRSGAQGLTRIAVMAQAGCAVTLFAVALTGNLFWAAILTILNGFAVTSAAIAAQTLVQRRVPDHVLARVLAIYSLIHWGGPAIGALLLGWLADMMGFRIPLLSGAVAMIVVLLFALPSLRRAQTSFEKQ